MAGLQKVAIITGAGTGIGKAVALALMREGCAAVLAGRRKDKLEETAAEASSLGAKALVVPTDGPPRRQVAGLDPRRFHIVAAVTDRVAGRLREAVPAGAGRRDGRSLRSVHQLS